MLQAAAGHGGREEVIELTRPVPVAGGGTERRDLSCVVAATAREGLLAIEPTLEGIVAARPLLLYTS